MTTTSVTEMGLNFAGYLKASEEGPVVVTRNGKPVAVLLRTADTGDLDRLLMGCSPQLQSILEAARKRFRAGEGIPHDVFWREVEAENSGRLKKRNKARKGGRNESSS
jgi:prevent-host-death family protein